MKRMKDLIKGRLVARMSAALLLALGSFCSVMAESKVYMDNFTLQPGQEKTVAVNLDNGDGIAGMEMIFTLPEGIEYVSFKPNEDRLERGVHTVNVGKQAAGVYKIGIFPMQGEAIYGETGALVYLTLKAADSFTAQAKIKFSSIYVTDLSGKEWSLNGFTALVSPEVGSVTTGEESFSIRKGGMHRVDVVLNNKIDVFGLQGHITLPAGLDIEKNSKGRYVFGYGDRLPGDAVVSYQAETGTLVVHNPSSHADFGKEGVLFSFNVVAGDELAETSEIVLSDFVVSGTGNVGYIMEDVVKVKVTNSYIADYTPLMETLADLQAKLDAAVAYITEKVPGVKENEDVVKATADIQAQIDAMKAAVQTAYDSETLGTETEKILAEVPTVEAAIEALKETAVHISLLDTAAGLQAKLDAAVAYIAEKCPDVKENADVVKATADIQAQIDALKAAIETAYGDKALGTKMEEILAGVPAIEAAIEALKETAVHISLLDTAAALQTKLDEAIAYIAEKCPDVKDNEDLVKAEADIQAMIDALKAAIEAAYGDKKLVAGMDEILAVVPEIEAAIEKLMSDATAAQKEFDETSGIGSVTAAKEDTYAIYTLSGKKVQTPVRGQVNIVVYEDGTVRKVLVK